MGKKLFVSNIDFEITEDKLRDMFMEISPCMSVVMAFDRDSKRSKGFAFVEMEADEGAKAVVEKLKEEKKQAGVIILREAYPGYIPLGVFNVRENVRRAMHLSCQHFETFDAAINYAASRLKLRMGTWLQHSTLFKEEFVQKRLKDFARAAAGSCEKFIRL